MPDVLANGVIVPKPTEPISASGVAEMRTLGQSVDTALGQAPDPWTRGLLADGTNFDSLTGAANAGFWGLGFSSSYTNAPPEREGRRANLEVHSDGFTTYQTVRFYSFGWVIQRWVTNYSTNAWSDWRRVDVDRAEIPQIVTITGGSLDDLRADGEYLINSGSTAQTITGWPVDVLPNTARMEVRMNTTGIGFQTLHIFGADGGVFERRTATISTTPFPWSPWRRLDSEGGGDESGAPAGRVSIGLRNIALREDFTRRHGGTIPTGQKGAVAIRCDHGLTNFRDVVLPMTRAAGIKASQAINSRNWEYAENAGVTADDVNAWVAAGEVEVWNHSASHTNATTVEALETEIITGLAELRSQIPAAQIDGWAIPGVNAQSPYMGFNNGLTALGYPDSIAGRMILEHHAVATGHIPGTHQRVLDGTVRQAQLHLGMDSRPVSQILAEIDNAIADRTGLQLMVHPSLINQNGYITTAQLQQILDYIVAKRDAGELVTLSPYELMVADSRF